jgi:hypothetical protein
VEALLEPEDITPEELATTVAVGLAAASERRLVELDGRSVDLLRLFSLGQAKELEGALEHAGIPVLLAPVEKVHFPDLQPRFELRVRGPDEARAIEVLTARWRAGLEEGAGALPEDVEVCPACGAHVPLEAEECPDCGLVIGASTEGDEEDEGAAE